MQTQNSPSLEFVKSLHSLSSNQQSQHLVSGICQMGFSSQPLDDEKAKQIAQAVAPFLPQQQPQNPFAAGGFNMMGTAGVPPPSIGGYQMSAPSFNPGPIPGAVATGAGSKPKYTEQDFRNMLAQGKSVCSACIKSGDRKGCYCCVEIKTYNSQLPADQQICPTHGKTKKAANSMNGAGVVNAFTNMGNMQFAPPIGLPNQTPIGGMQQQPWQQQMGGIQQQQQPSQMPWQTQQIPGLNQQQLTPIASVMAPGLGLINQQNQNGMQQQPQIPALNGIGGQQNSNPFSISSNPTVGLTPPNNGMQQQFQSNPMIQQPQQSQPWQQSSPAMQNQQQSVQIPTFSMNQQQPQTSFNPLGGVANSQIPGMSVQQTSQQMPLQSAPIPTISMSFQQQPQTSFNSMSGSSNIQTSGMTSVQSNGIPQISIPSLTSSMSNMSMSQPNIQLPSVQQNQFGQNMIPQIQPVSLPQQQPVSAAPSQGEFFSRKMGNEDFYFNTDPVVSGVVFENTVSGIVCVGRIGTTVNNDGNQLPSNFKEMIGHSFTLDHDNWLTSKGISKKDTSAVTRTEENIPEDFQADDA